jgi:hypothetical protein
MFALFLFESWLKVSITLLLSGKWGVLLPAAPKESARLVATGLGRRFALFRQWAAGGRVSNAASHIQHWPMPNHVRHFLNVTFICAGARILP